MQLCRLVSTICDHWFLKSRRHFSDGQWLSGIARNPRSNLQASDDGERLLRIVTRSSDKIGAVTLDSGMWISRVEDWSKTLNTLIFLGQSIRISYRQLPMSLNKKFWAYIHLKMFQTMHTRTVTSSRVYYCRVYDFHEMQTKCHAEFSRGMPSY